MPVSEQKVERIIWLVTHHHTYTNIDGIDYQILIEADFLVNASESNFSKVSIENAKSSIFKTAALALTDDSVSIDDSELMKEEKLAVILGNEGEGLENETIALCDYTVKIPMTHGVDSLNVAAASAVAFWQLGKIIL